MVAAKTCGHPPRPPLGVVATQLAAVEMLAKLKAHAMRHKDLDPNDVGTYLQWVDRGGMTYPSKKWACLVTSIFDVTWSNFHSKRQDDDLCVEVADELLGNDVLQGQWATLVEVPARKAKDPPCPGYCRLVGLLLHCSSNELLRKVNAPLAQSHGTTRAPLKNGGKSRKSKGDEKPKTSKPTTTRGRRGR